ncbi:MAG: hypothetical protein JWP12_1851 [Bacteroidetes bacterium]|nr:hypothetical protein [Bacteroidota bacterium]
MSDEKHTIKKAIVEIHLSKADGAHDAQNKALAYFKEKIVPLIERMIDRLSSPNEVIRIEKLELDFHRFNLQQTDDAALQKFERHVEEKLMKLISEERSNHFPGEVIAEIKKIPRDKADLELLIHLLKTGNLPWWSKTEQAIVLETLAQQVLHQAPDPVKKEIAAALIIPAVRKRIAHKLSADSIEKIISLTAVSPYTLLNYVNEFLRFIKGSAEIPESLRMELYEYVLARTAFSETDLQTFVLNFIRTKNDAVLAGQLYKQSNAVASSETTLAIKQSLVAANEHFEGRIRKMFTGKDVKLFFEENKEEQTERKKEAAKQKEEDKKAEDKKVEEKKISVAGGNKITEKAADKTAENAVEKAAEKKMDEAKEKRADRAKENPETVGKTDEKNPAELMLQQAALKNEDGDYFIKNAGVVILAPYLSALFRQLGLCDGNAFVSEEAKERAAYLLQYLATGATDAEEHEMVLNKVLCGIDLQQPFTLQFIISEQEKEECQGLLQAVADNWSALRGTSGEGMRDAFFMRDGILEQQFNGWNLKIEKNTIDILLNKLPWGISILQMPWSKEMIFVTW